MLFQCDDKLSLLLSHLATVVVTSIDAAGPVVVIRARTRSDTLAWCNGCGEASDKVHSRYIRHLSDTAIGGRPVRTELNVRRCIARTRLVRR